jgi:tetratricopeptide (TPR) repeat protein
MAAFDWSGMNPGAGVLREPVPGEGHIVLWRPASGEGQPPVPEWQRISSGSRADISADLGMLSVPANAIRVRVGARGFFSKLFGKPSGQTWLLPNGQSAEQVGERRTDLLLVWPQEGNLIDRERITARWPNSQSVEPLGAQLFLVSGTARVEPARDQVAAAQEGPRQTAEKLLAAARGSGDRARVVTALIDLGIAWQGEGDAPRSAEVLEEALSLARQLDDRNKIRDALNNLSLARLYSGQAPEALAIAQEDLALARSSGDRFAEKLSLDHLGLIYSSMRQSAEALSAFQQALNLAREVQDDKQEARLLWFIAIQLADMDQRDQAVAVGREAVEVLRKKRDPQAAWFAELLGRYRRGEIGIGQGPGSGNLPAGAVAAFASGWGAGPTGPVSQEQTAQGPGLLRMAFSATKAMAKFIGTGFSTVTQDTHQRRLRTCGSCEHHTGIRCKLCGCFTYVKAALPHEKCPIGKWS